MEYTAAIAAVALVAFGVMSCPADRLRLSQSRTTKVGADAELSSTDTRMPRGNAPQ